MRYLIFNYPFNFFLLSLSLYFFVNLHTTGFEIEVINSRYELNMIRVLSKFIGLKNAYESCFESCYEL